MNRAKTNFSGVYYISHSPYESTFCLYNLRRMSHYIDEKKTGLTLDKKKILKYLQGIASSPIDFNKIREEQKYGGNIDFSAEKYAKLREGERKMKTVNENNIGLYKDYPLPSGTRKYAFEEDRLGSGCFDFGARSTVGFSGFVNENNSAFIDEIGEYFRSYVLL